MALVSLGDMAQSFLLRRHNAALKSDLQTLSTELTTGRVSDIAARVSGDLVPLSGIDASLARLKGYTAVTNEAGLFAGAMQTALGVISDLSTELSSNLISSASSSASVQVDTVAANASQRFETAISALNTRFGDRSLFAGTATNSAAVADASTMLQGLMAAVGTPNSAADVEAAVTAWFDGPTGFATQGYIGGPPTASVAIAPGEEAQLNVTGMDPAIRTTLKGLAMAALLDKGVLAGQPAARQDLARRAGVSLLESQTDRAYLSARLGTVEAQIDSAKARNSAESTSLEIARSDIVGADPFETASKLEETQAQLEKIYAITARMTRLSLMDYL